MMGYRLEKMIPTRHGAFAVYGGTYRWLWMARFAAWLGMLCPDLRAHKAIHIVPTSEG